MQLSDNKSLKFVLKVLINNNDYISGEDISGKLNLTRAAVWKYIKKLRDKGYVIDALPRRGYKLVSIPDNPNSLELLSAKKNCLIGSKINYLETASSTNDLVLDAFNKGEKDGFVAIVARQSAGRGRLNRRWFSDCNENLYMSVLLKPNCAPHEIHSITLSVGIAIIKAIEKNYHGLKVKMKWPNDIYINNLKIGGILSESRIEIDLVHYLVVGIGLNVNEKRENMSKEIRNIASSLFSESEKTYVPLKKVAEDILSEMDETYIKFRNKDFRAFYSEWNSYSMLNNKEVKIQQHGQTLHGKVMKIAHDGALMIKLKSGGEQKVYSGDISITGRIK